jgi:hypothetical protein
LYQFFDQFAGHGGPWLLCLYLAGAVLTVLAGVRSWRRYGRSTQSWPYAVVLSWFVAPVLITLMVTLVRPLFIPRYLIISLPAFILIAVAGWTAHGPRWMILPVLGVMVWLGVGGIRSYYDHDFDILRNDFRNSTAYVLDHASPGDAILFYPSYGRCGYEYYADHYSPTGNRPMIVAPGHGDRMIWRDFIGRVSPQVLDQVTREYPRVWVVLSNYAQDEPFGQQIENTIARRYRLVEQRSFTGVGLYLYAP